MINKSGQNANEENIKSKAIIDPNRQACFAGNCAPGLTTVQEERKVSPFIFLYGDDLFSVIGGGKEGK